MKNNHILIITGITGKSGLFFLEELLKESSFIEKKYKEVRLSIHSESKINSLKQIINNYKSKINFNFVVGNLKDEEYCNSLCNNGECLIHIAGIDKSELLVKCAVNHNISKIVLVHTTGIYSKYKQAGEGYRNIESRINKMIDGTKTKITILKPTMIYGNINDHNISVFIKMVDKFKLMPVVNGAHYELQPVHCKDLGIAYFQVLKNIDKVIGRDYILSGGEPIELRQIFEEIAKNLGVKRKYISCPFFIAYAGAWFIYLLSFTKFDFREKVQRLCEPRIFSHEKATKDFGYSPMTFQEGIVGEVYKYKKHKEMTQ